MITNRVPVIEPIENYRFVSHVLLRTRALQGIENLPCPALPGQGRAGQGKISAGQGRIRLQKILQGRLQVTKVVTC